MEKKVAILMSTYNGEEYIESQIKSIIDQTYKNWILYIRDDGSTDDTINIIKKYSNEYSNIVFFNKKEERNVGVVKSFMTLLENVSADYYMFSDQDDYWLNNKVKDSVNELEKQSEGPICVFTDVEIVNEKLVYIRRMNGKNVWPEFKHLLFSNCVTGCTIIINEELKRLIKFKLINYNYLYMHDWWIALLASSFGKLIYLNKVTMLYRQHKGNVVGSSKKNTISHTMYRLFHMKRKRQQAKYAINMIYEFNKEYPNTLHGDEKKYVEEYALLKNKSSFWYNLKLIIRLVPPRLTKKQKLLFSYLLVIYHQDFLK